MENETITINNTGETLEVEIASQKYARTASGRVFRVNGAGHWVEATLWLTVTQAMEAFALHSHKKD